MMVAVNGEMGGFKADLGGRVYRALLPWVGGIAEEESVTDDFQFPDMRYCFQTWKVLEGRLAWGWSEVGDTSRSQVQF